MHHLDERQWVRSGATASTYTLGRGAGGREAKNQAAMVINCFGTYMTPHIPG